MLESFFLFVEGEMDTPHSWHFLKSHWTWNFLTQNIFIRDIIKSFTFAQKFTSKVKLKVSVQCPAGSF